MTRSVRVGSGLIAGLLLVYGQVGQAQSCRGLPSLSRTSKVLSASAMGSGNPKGVLGRFGVNGEHGFAGVQAGYAGYQFDHPTAALVGIDAGYAFQLGKRSGLELCPLLQSVVQNGWNGPAVHQTWWTTSLGLSLGRSFRDSRTIGLVPFVQGSVTIRPLYYSFIPAAGMQNLYPSLNSGGRVSGTDTDYMSETRVGLGLRLGDRLMLTPTFIVPHYPGPSGFSYGPLGNARMFSLSASIALPRTKQ